MRHLYLLANLDREDLAQRLVEELRRHVESRENLDAGARVFSRGGRVSVTGVPQPVAVELRKWCAEKLKELDPSRDREALRKKPPYLDGVYSLSEARNLLRLRTGSLLLGMGNETLDKRAGSKRDRFPGSGLLRRAMLFLRQGRRRHQP